MATENKFIEATKHLTTTTTENGAGAYTTVGSVLSSQFGQAATYRDRELSSVFIDQEALWHENPQMALAFPFYLRLITRKTKINGVTTKTIQSGQGQRDESFKRLLWIAKHHPATFNENIWLLPIVGSWKDVWTLLYYDCIHKTDCIAKEVIFELLKYGLSQAELSNLVKKFMPRIKANSKCTTEWTKIHNLLAKSFAKYLSLKIADYNAIKSTGTAHEFQKLICTKQFDKLNWNHIPGKALNLLINSKFLTNQKLVDVYTKFVESQTTVKYTGYAYELVHQLLRLGSSIQPYQTVTINKQFDELVSRVKKHSKITSNVWCAIDSSSSMSWESCSTGGITPYDVAVGLGIFFSTLIEGAFHKNIIAFDDVSHIHQLKGNFSDMVSQIPKFAMGGTNFLSVVKEIVRIRKENPDIPLEDYPTSLLVVSDMQFNAASHKKDAPATYTVSRELLLEAFPEDWVDNFKFIWWNCNARVENTFPSNLNDEACYYFSGFDGSVISLLLGEEVNKKTPLTQEELVHKALSQEILTNLVIKD